MRKSWWLILVLVAGLGASLTLAQRFSGRGSMRGYSGGPPDRQDLPTWKVDKEFQQDVFTFVRIRYSGYGGGRGFGRGGFGRGGFGGGAWATDYPDADLNFSYRLHQLTSLEVNPDGLVLELTDPELFNYPFIHINPGDMGGRVNVYFTDDEVKCLRKYLLNGGFLFVTDFWGMDEWEDFHTQMRRVFPDREPEELTIDHPIFHCVFDLKKIPQIPAIENAMRGRAQGITWERSERPDTKDPHFMAYFDDKGRMMALMAHNCDITDGWEREGDNEWYFHEFAEKQGYPFGINMVFYAMTH